MSDAPPPYGAPSPDPSSVVSVIDGHSGRKVNNALTLTFFEGSEEPFATALQGGGDGFGKKMGILFGLKNGAPGKHVLTYTDGSTIVVETRDAEPSPVTRGDGTVVATITRGATSTATLPDGSMLFGFHGHPVDAMTPEKFRILVTDAAGAEVATIEVIRQGGSWDLAGDLLDLAVFGSNFTQTGRSLPIPFLGTRVLLHRAISPVERDVLLAVCVDIGIGIRPYFKEMGGSGASWT